MGNKIFFSFLLIAGLYNAIGQQTDNRKVNYAEKVNTLIGSKGKGHGISDLYLEAGFTFPGAMYPFGMVQFTPTFFNASKGFVVNQLSGAGCPNMGNFPTMPLSGKITASPDDMNQLSIGNTFEKGEAGYFKVKLNTGIDCELTATKRTGMAKYHFSPTEKYATVIIGSGINATKITTAHIRITDAHSCEGSADGGSFCGIATNYKIFFVAQFDQDAFLSGTWKNKKIHTDSLAVDGNNSGAYFTFDVSQNKTLQYKFGISYVSVENARQNLKAENNQWNFSVIKTKAQNAWNTYLSKIEVSGSSEVLTRQFYTNLYHAFAHPSLFNDINGEYMGPDYKVHNTKTAYYTAFSNWDTYRTQIQLISLLAPERASEMIGSLIDFATQSNGGLPRWVMANVETGIMQGDPTSILISNAYAFGAKNFNYKQAFQLMRKGAEIPGTNAAPDIETRPYLKAYLEKGYINASMQLEYASADFAIGEFALQALKDTALYAAYLQRAQHWKNLYNPANKWLQSRNEDGSWKNLEMDMREASYKSYFWMVPFNLGKLIDTIGGKQFAANRLDSFFVQLNADYNQPWFAAGNEPDFQVPWIYNWVGTPDKTQLVVKRIIKEQYADKDNGLPGNDDLGAMGAWYVFANIGLYPVIPGIGGFAINSPSFPVIKIHLPDNKDLIIRGGSETKPYISSLYVNGKIWNKSWIPLAILKNAKTLVFSLSDLPVNIWGTRDELPSFNKPDSF